MDTIVRLRFEFFMEYKDFFIVWDRKWSGFRGISKDDTRHTAGRFGCDMIIREINSERFTAHDKPIIQYIEFPEEK